MPLKSLWLQLNLRLHKRVRPLPSVAGKNLAVKTSLAVAGTDLHAEQCERMDYTKARRIRHRSQKDRR